MHRRKDGRTRVRAARRRWRWSCPANIGESDDSRRKMSDGRVVEDVSGVEWDNKRTNDRDRDRDRGEQEVGRICEEGRNNSCCGRNGTTEEPKAEKACIRNAPLTRPRKTPTRSRSVEMEKDAQKWIEVVGWPRMDDTYKMLITSEISVQRYIERWPWLPPVQPSPECKELYRIFLVLSPLRAQFPKSFSTDIIGRSRR